MIGRQRVLAQSRAAAEAAIGAGQGQVVLLAGEAGIGKTAVATEAAAEARQRGARVLWASCLVAWHNVIWGPGSAGERLALTKEIADLAARRGNRELQVEPHLLRVADLLELADPAAHQELAEFIGAAEALRQPRLRYAALARRAMRALMTGRFGEVERLVGEAVALGAQIGEPDVRQVEFAQLWDLRSAQGRRRELMETLGSGLPADSPITICCAAMAALEAGRREQAEAILRELPELDPSALPMDRSWMVALAWIGELAAGLGDPVLCQRVRDALAPYDGGAVVIGAAVTFHGAVAHHLGRLEAALGRTPQALAHFQRGAGHPRAARRPPLGPAQPLRAGRPAAAQPRPARGGLRGARRDRRRGRPFRHGRAGAPGAGPPGPAGRATGARDLPPGRCPVDAGVRREGRSHAGRQGAARPRRAARRARAAGPCGRAGGRLGRRGGRPGEPAPGRRPGPGRAGPPAAPRPAHRPGGGDRRGRTLGRPRAGRPGAGRARRAPAR
jgi:hypothetical protein